VGAHASVREAVVLAREDRPGDKRLVAYVVAHDAAPEPADLRVFLAARLPEHMVPSAFVVLPVLPLTPNGKVDRRALPAPDVAGGPSSAFAAPRTPTEEAIAAIWKEVLGLPRVNVEEDFFELGGHSLLAMQIMARIAERVRVELPLATLFELKTVAKLAEIADAVLSSRAPAPSVAGLEEGEL
jgi:nonribosomal peptide synthetase DhbF